MQNLKIKVNSEAESKEAQELFFELGYAWATWGKSYSRIGSDCTHLTTYTDGELTMGIGDANTELNLPQLHDLVVLKRNDLNDATHTDQNGWSWFIASTGIGYVFEVGNAEQIPRWDEASLVHADLTAIEKFKQNSQNALVLGTDFLEITDFIEAVRAVKKGISVEYTSTGTWYSLNNEDGKWTVAEIIGNKYRFRRKPEFITIGKLAVPTPVSPDTQALPDDTDFWIADPSRHDGKFTRKLNWDGANCDLQHLKRGLVHLTEASAIAHAKALIVVSGGSIDQ